MTSSDPSIARLQAAVLDGRTANIRYRQDQFQKLFKILSENADTLAEAIAKDNSATAAEVEVELFLTLDSVRHFYDGFNFERELKEEYSLKNGEDNEGRRIGVGIVLVRPTIHTRLYSVLTPTCAAIAAWNCVLLDVYFLPSSPFEF
jgi:acyl-CoA reductase-like NAD-dependent aldehyde dehydrogenase